MTKNTGSHQNAPDLDGNTFKLVRFSEVETAGKVAWYFFADQCRHCLQPPCKDAIEGYVKDGVVLDEATGAVVYGEKAKEARFDEVKSSCPYDIPRQAADKKVVKCTMCIDRVSNGLLPACVKVCPTGAMNFGDRDAMLVLAQERLEKLKGKYPKAQLLDADQVRTIFLVVDEPAKYHKNAVAGLRKPADQWRTDPDAELQGTITEAEFLQEISRCFSCGLCYGCEQSASCSAMRPASPG